MPKSFKEIEVKDRPRERLHRLGADQLKNEELIQILLGSGVRGADVRTISKQIAKSLEGKRDINKKDLEKIKGIGAAKIPVILAAIEFGRRQNYDAVGDISLMNPKDVWEYMQDIRKSQKEHFVVLYLNSRDREICREVVSIGTVNASMVHPREVFGVAIKHKAGSIIGVHNHPSRVVEPSDADIQITKRLVEAGRILGIEFFDHIIVTEPKKGKEDTDKFCSLRERHSDLFDW